MENEGACESLLWAEDKQEKSTELIKQINSRNAKLIACCLVVGFILYHGIVHFRYGNDSCKWLLSDGKYKGDMEWQPYGCMMHHYTQLDTRRCIRYLAFWGKHNYFVFIGDSRILDIYSAFIDHLTGSGIGDLNSANDPVDQTNQINESRKHGSNPSPGTNHTFNDPQLRVRVDFVWSPYISENMVNSFHRWKVLEEPPNLIVAGNGLWSIRSTNGSTRGIKEYTFNLTKLIQPMEILCHRKSRVLWVLQEPVSEEQLPSTWAAVSNYAIDQYNWAAREVLRTSTIQVWSSSRALVWGYLFKSSGNTDWNPGLPPRSLPHHTQILANLHCNDHMAFHDGTCCSSPEHITTLQSLTFTLLALCGAGGVMLGLRRYRINKKTQSRDAPSSSHTLLVSLAKLGAILAYCYLCDRTNFFMKENKYYSAVSFWLPLGYLFALGLFFTEDSRYTKVLHKDQTEEWKGWMQLVLMVYHYTGASSSLVVSNHVQMVNSAFFFLNGYSHFYYLWHRHDAGIVRFFQALFKLNVTPVLLCLTMNRPYQFYPFACLISFWFTLLYVTLVIIPPRVTSSSTDTNPLHYLYLVLKIVGLFAVITILYLSEVFFEKVFVTRPWKALFVTTDDDIRDWWVRWKLNRYSTCYGVVFGLILVSAHRWNLVDDSNHSNLLSRRFAVAAVLLSLLGLVAAVVRACLCPDQLDCHEIHSYSAFLPVVCYVVLRNVSGVLRCRYSSLFAWFGRISQELCYLQVHVWLGADSHGVLVFVPGYPVLNALITSFIFVCAAHEMQKLTVVLMPYAVPKDWRLVLRNFFIFIMILVPIGIHDGMF